MIARPTTRRFTLSDAMVLVAAIAIGLALDQSPFEYAWSGATSDKSSLGPALRVTCWMRLGFAIFSPPLMPLTIALLALRLRPPRPRRARLFLRPGTVALVAASSAILLQALATIPWVYSAWGSPQKYELFEDNWAQACNSAGIAVISAWVVLALAGRWSPEPSWIDRAGRCAGALWSICPFWSTSIKYINEFLT